MVTVKAGSHTYQLLQLLSVTGEFPTSSLRLLGSERSLKDLLFKLEQVQELRLSKGGPVLTTKVLQVSGKRGLRTIRLHKGVLPLLDEICPGALKYYLAAFQNHIFSGNIHHIGRNHRVAEAIAIAMMAGLEFRPVKLPKLQNDDRLLIVPPAPCFFIARDFKETMEDQMSKTRFTRIVGAVFYPGGCYAVYNTRGAVMRWSGAGEYKTMNHLLGLARCNAGLRNFNAALLLGNNPDVALQTILESDKSTKHSMRMDKTYHSVHFLPLNADGIRLLQILTLPDWNEKILDAMFEPEQRLKGFGFMEYDAKLDGAYVLSHLDSDLARLIRFREGLRTEPEKRFEVVCYPWQKDFLRAYMGERVKLRMIAMEVLHNGIQ